MRVEVTPRHRPAIANRVPKSMKTCAYRLEDGRRGGVTRA
jgi:hypothetical protein